MPGQGYDFSDDDDQGTLEQQGYDEVPEPPQRRRPAPEMEMSAAEPSEYEQEPREMQVVDVQPGDEETSDEDYQELVSHVDRRLRIAQNFRLVLDSPLFGEETPESKVVQSRIRKFVRQEIEVLFGMKAAPVGGFTGSPFTQEEVDALKALAAATISAKRRSTEPKLNRIAAPAAPVVAKPPQALKPIAAAPAPVVPAPRPQTPKPQQSKPPQQATKQPQQPQSSYKPGELPNNVVPGNPGLKTDPRVPDDYRNDPTLRIKNGHVYVQQRDNESGELLWVHQTGLKRPIPMLKDVTPISKPVGPIQPVPMPSLESMEMFTNQLASSQAVQNLERLAIKLDPVFKGRIGF